MQMDSLNLNEGSNVHTLYTHEQGNDFLYFYAGVCVSYQDNNIDFGTVGNSY